jgi:hypothetical protein
MCPLWMWGGCYKTLSFNPLRLWGCLFAAAKHSSTWLIHALNTWALFKDSSSFWFIFKGGKPKAVLLKYHIPTPQGPQEGCVYVGWISPSQGSAEPMRWKPEALLLFLCSQTCFEAKWLPGSLPPNFSTALSGSQVGLTQMGFLKRKSFLKSKWPNKSPLALHLTLWRVSPLHKFHSCWASLPLRAEQNRGK